MLRLSSDTDTARQQLDGVVFYLTTLGSIDGELDPSEMSWVLETIRRLVGQRAVGRGEEGESEQMIAEAEAAFEAARGEVSRLLDESVERGEGQEQFVAAKLKHRCFAIFRSFDVEQQAELINVADDLLLADGSAHPAEVRFREELIELLRVPVPILLLPEAPARRIELVERERRSDAPADHPLFAEVERHWSPAGEQLAEEIEAERRLVIDAMGVFEDQRLSGLGRLSGLEQVDELAPGDRFLDEYVYVLQPSAEQPQEVTIIGDLHGCYSNLKAALIQSRFLQKVEAYRADPTGHRRPSLVLLGDYLDRGFYSYEGTLRMAMRLLTTYPDHVMLLRGNHEFYTEYEGRVVSTVMPAEAIERMRPWAPSDLLETYRRFFDALPGSVLLGRTLLTHGGVPMDAVVREKVVDLSGLNDWTARFQMMWSDPCEADVVPRTLQDATYRFGFGRLQCLGFLQRLGCNSLIRGHEHLPEGFRRDFNDEQMLMVTVFSSGGAGNADLPGDSDLRLTRPMAATLITEGELDGPVRLELWPLDFARYNSAETNRFYATEPGLPF